MASSSSEKKERSATDRLADFLENFSVWDFVDPNKPWVLTEHGSFLGYFDFIPKHYRYGPWSLTVILSLATISYLLLLAGVLMSLHPGWWENFYLADGDSSYQAFTHEWYYTFAAFAWMLYVMWHVLTKSPIGIAAWIAFTLWSWTILSLRHGLVLIAPFLPSVRIWAELLRFPALLSASITTVIWNFVLFPILILFIKDVENRRKFIGYFTNFRLTQLHVFNLFFAVTNCAMVKPTRQLHMGDMGAMVVLIVAYMAWYYFILDRLGIHLYPIFSPRTPLALFSYILIIAACTGGYHFWKGVLAGR